MSFTDELRRDSDAIWQANFAHPFVQAIGDGTLGPARFAFYLAQVYVFIVEYCYCRFFGLAVAKAADLETMGRLANVLDATLNTEMDLHRRVCADFGLTAEHLKQTEPAPN